MERAIGVRVGLEIGLEIGIEIGIEIDPGTEREKDGKRVLTPALSPLGG
jgi:hypothetical protein